MSFATIDETHDPDLRCWIAGAHRHAQFPVQNLPFGIFSDEGKARRPGVAIGDFILDISALASRGMIPGLPGEALFASTLNALFALPSADRVALRKALSAIVCDESASAQVEACLLPAGACVLHLPFAIGDYTDFYVGIHHATNVGKLFRPDNPLLPNYKYVPIGYHGRASSVRPSGVPVTRPTGQRKARADDAPLFGPSTRLDYELELGVWIGPATQLGEIIPISAAADHIAGFCLLNDWSARDVQAWEYVPLGPFLAKSFHTTISPWVVMAEALAPFRVAQPPRPAGDPSPLPYLDDGADRTQGALSIALEVYFTTAAMRSAGIAPQRLSRGSATDMYWTVQQIVTHHASNGCNLNPGDLLGTGTISAPTREGYGSLLELTEGGKTSFTLPTGETRSFLEDGDEVTLAAIAHAEGYVPIGFGECRAMVQPARSPSV